MLRGVCVCSLLFANPLPSRTAAVFYSTLSRPQLTESNRGTPLSCSPVNRPASCVACVSDKEKGQNSLKTNDKNSELRCSKSTNESIVCQTY